MQTQFTAGPQIQDVLYEPALDAVPDAPSRLRPSTHKPLGIVILLDPVPPRLDSVTRSRPVNGQNAFVCALYTIKSLSSRASNLPSFCMVCTRRDQQLIGSDSTAFNLLRGSDPLCALLYRL